MPQEADESLSATAKRRRTRPLGLYLHVPFCETKCGYCDFFSIPLRNRDPAPLVTAILHELGTRLAGERQNVRTVFCGGGTPTILTVDELARLLESRLSVVEMGGVEEFTVEANPATVDDEKAALLVDSGVTRVSMGAQSFFPKELEALERLHSPDDIEPCVVTLRRAGVRHLNLDLIFGIPGQTVDTWTQSMRRAIELEPDHIACYGLTYEPGTRLTAQRRAGRVTPCEENLEVDMYVRMIDTLSEAGFHQYEISNFAKPGCECLHNLRYWRNEPFIGVGPSAAGCVDGRRYKNIADVAGYVRLIDAQGHAEVESEILDDVMLMTEMVMMQLRLVEGLSVEGFRARTGVDPLTLFDAPLSRLTDLGFITVSDSRIALTGPGRLVADAVIRELVAACDAPSRHLSVAAN